MVRVDFCLSYEGSLAEENKINLYDVSRALTGFQRSLAITTHLILNDEVIVQAPYLKGAEILASMPESGSWKIVATVLAGVYALGTASKDTPIGHVISSAYDYVISESLGFHVDYNKTLGQQYDELKSQRELKKIEQYRLDSVIDKCQASIKDMHRPIFASGTAVRASITAAGVGFKSRFSQNFTSQTYDYINYSIRSAGENEFSGVVSSYNSNTFKGRVYISLFGRTVPFELDLNARNTFEIGMIVNSLSSNAKKKNISEIKFRGFLIESRAGQVKSIIVTQVLSEAPLREV